MTWKDKLEIGLKDDAPYRRDNLPAIQRRNGGPGTKPGDPTRSPEEPGARQAAMGTSVRRIPRPSGGARPRTAARKKEQKKGTSS